MGPNMLDLQRAKEIGRTIPTANDVPPALQVGPLSVGYGDRPVLKGLQLTVQPSEIFGLLGPNGAGKTTLIRAICGRFKSSTGDIFISGRSNRERRALSRIGMVPQEIALYPHLTARENLVAFGRLSGLSRRDTTPAMDFAMQATRLAGRGDDPVHTLSGGWKRRVNIAAALMHRPTLLILDEPTVGVDIDARNTLHAVIRDLSHTGLAVLLATHDLDQAQTLCGRVGFLRDGVLSPVGNPAALLWAAFAERREMHVDLFEPASEQTNAMMRRLHFTEHPSGLEWSRMINTSAHRQAELTDALHETDLRIKDVRFRKPGLDNLIMRLGKAEPKP